MFSSSRPQNKTSCSGAETLYMESSQPQQPSLRKALAGFTYPVLLIGCIDLAQQVCEPRHSLLPRREGVYPGELIAISSARSRPSLILPNGYSPATVDRPLLL